LADNEGARQSNLLLRNSGRQKLKKEHIDFLVDPKTLEDWAEKTLDERAVLFHR
jgi:hypothetical protein